MSVDTGNAAVPGRAAGPKDIGINTLVESCYVNPGLFLSLHV